MLLDPAYPTSTLYVLSDPLTQARTAPFYRALLDEVTRFWYAHAASQGASRRSVPPEQRLLLVFDDAAHVAALPHLDELAANGGDHGVVLALGLRDLASLRTRLGGDTAEAVVNNCLARVITGGMADATTLKLVNDLVGPAEVQTSLTTEEPAVSTAHREVLTAAELRDLAPGRAVVVTGTEPPIRAQLLDQSDFATPADAEPVSAVGWYPSPMPEKRWPFQPR
jgi:type IV secretory pathway TraG/TraD family ATPase VirD4